MKKRHFLGIGIAALLPLSQAFTEEIAHQTWNQIRSLRGIPTQPGMTRPTLFVFFDPNCPHCATLWSLSIDAKPFHDIPSVWIPVAYLKKSSLNKSAACLRSGRKQDLHNNFSNYDRQQRQGAIAGVEPTQAERSALDLAKKLWTDLGGGTPMLAYRTLQGSAQVLIGLHPEKYMTDLVRTMALPASI